MRVFVDENIPGMTVQSLREMGHDVRDIRGTADEGMVDEALWERVQEKECLLITTDRGFSQHRDEQHHGILIVLLRRPNRHRIHTRVLQAIAGIPEEEWPNLLVIMRDRVQSVWRGGG